MADKNVPSLTLDLLAGVPKLYVELCAILQTGSAAFF
jgi:hypothetical protein